MLERYGQCQESLILLHGGAGPQDPTMEAQKAATAELARIADTGMGELLNGKDVLDVAVTCLQGLEMCERFNAGRGSALQADGTARLTSSIMSGCDQIFSGVISATYIDNPSLLARHLQGKQARVLSPPGVELLARELGLPVASQITRPRLDRWYKKMTEDGQPLDTVGCVIRAADGRLVAATSTGGRGFEYPGRVSDSGTVAGNYASPYAAVSATGVGEQIIDDAVSARLETRVRDGMSLEDACAKSLEEASAKSRRYGWIAADAKGVWAVVHTTKWMSFVVKGPEGVLASS